MTQLSAATRGGFGGRPSVRLLRKHTIAYALLLPALGLVMMVTLYPILSAFDFSLYSATLARKDEFVGLENYRRIVTDPTLQRSLLNTFLYLAGAVPLTVGAGLLLAVVLNRSMRFRTTLRTLLLIPWVTSYLISALLWKWLLNVDYGPVSAALAGIGLPRVDFLGTNLAMTSLILTTVWNAYAFAMVILLAALQQVPDTLRKAAEVDGASAWMQFRRITFPLIKPSVLVAVIITSLHFLNIITLPLILTGGGPNRSTEVIALRLFNEAFLYFNTGLASAMAVLILVLNLVLTLFYVLALRQKRIY